MNSPAIHSNQLQMRTDTQRVGTDALGQCVSALTCRWQGRQHSRAVGSRVVYSDRLSAFLMLTLPETGGGRHKLPSSFQVSQPNDRRSSSPLVWAGRRVMRDSLTRSPAFVFVTAQHIRQDRIEPSESTHVCRAPFASNHAAKERVGDHNSRGERPEREGERHHVSE